MSVDMTDTKCRAIENDFDCCKPAVSYVTLNDGIIKADVPVCREHKALYNRKAAELRVSRR